MKGELFSQILGQEQAVGLLRGVVAQGRPASAYLFHGPDGVGKRLTARTFACALNCEAPPVPGGACGSCGPCRKVLSDNHPDVSFFSPEVKDIKIETVREIQRRMGLKLAEGRWRVFVLDGADFLNPSSANCLLKVLEEPSPQSLLVLLSENPRHLLPTILSRTQSVRFRPVPAPVIRTWLSGNGFSDTEADELSRLSQGRMSRIEALRDPERQKQRQKAMKAARDLPQWTPGTALRNAERLAQEARKAGRESLVDFLEELLFWQRDLLWIKTGGEEDGLTYFSEREQLAEQAVPLTLEQVRQRVEWIMEAIGMVRANVYAEMALAVTFLRLSGRMPAGSL